MRNDVDPVVLAIGAAAVVATVFIAASNNGLAKKMSALPQTMSTAEGTLLPVGATGFLVSEFDGTSKPQWCKFVLVDPMFPRVELGTVDNYTTVRDYTSGATYRGNDIYRFVGKRITVISVVKARVDERTGFSPLRVIRITILPRTMKVNP